MREGNDPAIERWRDIPDFDGLYQASTAGRIRRILPNGRTMMMSLFRRKNQRCLAGREALRVRLRYKDGTRVEKTVLRLVAETFLGIPDGFSVVHRNGLRSDNSISNIIFMPLRDLGSKYGDRGCRRPVCKVAPDGTVLECYSSARAAGRANYLNYQTVLDRCNGKVKNPFDLDGTNYIWDDGGYADEKTPL